MQETEAEEMETKEEMLERLQREGKEIQSDVDRKKQKRSSLASLMQEDKRSFKMSDEEIQQMRSFVKKNPSVSKRALAKHYEVSLSYIYALLAEVVRPAKKKSLFDTNTNTDEGDVDGN